MNRFIRLLLTAIGCCTGCSESQLATPRQFTHEFAECLRNAQRGLEVVVVKDLELKVTTADGRPSTSFLDNAYDMYRQDPRAKKDVIHRFVTARLEAITRIGDGVDSARIVPVIKDRPWLEETRQALLSRGAKQVPEYVHEDFSQDLIILYAEDSPKNIRYLVPKDLETAKIDRAGIRQLACKNLKDLLPKIEQRGANGLYILTAGGDYEASLLLLDSIWTNTQIEVKGDIVVAIPTRDLLLVTGSQDREGIEKVKRMVKEASNGGAYRLTQKLFIYRRGSFSEFNEATRLADPPNRSSSP